MSTVNYSLKNKGVRLIDAQDAWVKGKNSKLRLNPKYHIVGKIDTRLPSVIVTASDKKQPSFKGDFNSLNSVAKNQTVKHFYDEKGKRNKKTVAYFGIKKQSMNDKKRKAIKKNDKSQKVVYDYSKFFDFDEHGHIKGSYNSDGFFEPD